MSFFKNALASMVGTVLAMIALIGLLVLIIILSIASSKEGPSGIVRNDSILHIELDGLFTERTNKHGGGFDPFGSGSGTGLDRLIQDLRYAATDERIRGAFIEVKNPMAAPSTMRDIHKAIADFRASGKWVVAFSEFYTQSGYYLASAASEVYLYPEGEFDWRGLNGEVMFLKNMLDKLEIEAQVIRGPDNKYKSAVEPLIFDHMSDSDREQTAAYLGDIWRLMLEDISASRATSVAALNAAADSLSFMNSLPEAVDAGVITGLKYRDEVIALLHEKLAASGAEEAKDGGSREEDLPLVKMSSYHRNVQEKQEGNAKDQIAVIYAVGAIESGEGNDQTIGSERIVEALREAREDEDVKAIVLRVNSPGGSALASDVIWRETKLIRDAGKPLVVSMGDYAASGGYYISCAADKIFANPNTITGSIGVFGVIPNMEKFFQNKIGITFDRFKTNPNADLMSNSKPLNEKQLAVMEEMVAEVYTDFITKVAEGRGLSVAQVDSVAQGRVWSGEDALQAGLVDQLGDLQAAIAEAAALAGISEYERMELPEMIDPLQKFLEGMQNNTEAQQSLVREAIYREMPLLREVESLRNMKGVQARMPFILNLN